VAHFQSLVAEGQKTPLNPVLQQLICDMETYHREFVRVNFACSELGAGYLVVLGREYENFTAAINRTRWDDVDGIQQRLAQLEVAGKELDSAHTAILLNKKKLEELPADVLESPRAKDIIFALSMTERVHAAIVERCQAARSR
jgi:hypothetical protein